MRPRLSDLIDKSTKKLRPIVWVGVGLASLQQLVGHQRRVLLRRRAVAGSGLQRSRLTEDQYFERHLVHSRVRGGHFS